MDYGCRETKMNNLLLGGFFYSLRICGVDNVNLSEWHFNNLIVM